ncbi:DUF6609 family protein [Peribacillus sp. NPDC006672]|uniref:DUF6609 family protein n=1 Tax=Peribacillus sp. NPDC006672 TaxID=3390606 RepID=UPI003D06E272
MFHPSLFSYPFFPFGKLPLHKQLIFSIHIRIQHQKARCHLISILNSNISFDYFGYIDGLIKIIFGIFLLVPGVSIVSWTHFS